MESKFENIQRKFPVASTTCFALFLFLFYHVSNSKLFGQDTLARWEFAPGGSFYAPARATLNSGSKRAKFLPSVGWNISIGVRITSNKNRELMLYYTWGGTTCWVNTSFWPNDYPQLVHQEDWRFYLVHRYNAVGLDRRYYLESGDVFNIGVGNRFYVSTGNSFRVESLHAITYQNILVFRGYTEAPTSLLCPELNVGYSRILIKKYPSWRCALKLSWAPIRVIHGEYETFPDDPGYKSSGLILVRQSYLSFGLVYRRVKKDS